MLLVVRQLERMVGGRMHNRKRNSKGFDTTCFPCIHYRMQGCIQRIPGHPTIGPSCKYFNYSDLHRIKDNGTEFIPSNKQ